MRISSVLEHQGESQRRIDMNPPIPGLVKGAEAKEKEVKAPMGCSLCLETTLEVLSEEISGHLVAVEVDMGRAPQ